MKSSFTFISIMVLIILFGCDKKSKKSQNSNYINSMCTPVVSDIDWYKENNVAPLFEGLDVLHFPITTSNKLAQKYFNQGLVLAYGFNHAEAARSFYYATKLDSNCAMAYWGFAYVLGPNYNAGMESDNYERAYNAVQKSVELTSNCTSKEKALIFALSTRYVKEEVQDRRYLDEAYSSLMKKVFEEYSEDADIGALYAESIMDLYPWDLWEKDGSIKEYTVEILDIINQVLAINPYHIGAHHFYIHTVESSNNPELGLKSAALFDNGIVPGAGHLVHMPSHIYIRTGDYHKGTLSNINAVKVDSNYITACSAQGTYPLAYFPHNYHFMAATATLEGNSKCAIHAANKVSKHVNKQIMKEPGWGTLQHYYTIPFYIYVKFAKWDEILNWSDDYLQLKYVEAVKHYARGMAFLGKKEIEKAKIELNKLDKFSEDVTLREITIWEINSVFTLLQIAKRVLKAEILAEENEYNESIKLLNEAVSIEDNLNYNEPPDWFFSIRHHLGAIQLEAKKYNEAIITYKEDLNRLPKNGWALHGLKEAYTKLNNIGEVNKINNELSVVWATSDIELSSSRIK